MDLTVRPLAESDLAEADRIRRLAFGTFLGLPDPLSFGGAADPVRSRWRADPATTLGAFANDELVGSNFVTHWGSFAFFGPLTVRPDLWDRGVARRLLSATLELLGRWGTRQAGLFTFPHSPKHVALYQRFGFWPQHLTAVMGKPVPHTPPSERCSRYSRIAVEAREACLARCRAITDAIQPGLEVRREIEAVLAQHLGDTILVEAGAELVAFAIVHLGRGSEAGSGAAYVKFAAVRPSPGAAANLVRLLEACEALAAAEGLQQLVAGVNTARHDAYRIMLERGFRTFLQGVAMQRPRETGYNRPDCFVLDDWR